MKGKRFFDSITGEYFPVKGIAYYPRPNEGPLSILTHSKDFYTEEFRHLWEPDVESLRELGVNTIRIYAVDPSQNHDTFMCALQEAGIYVIIGLLADCENCGIGPGQAPSCYPLALKNRGQWIINTFSKYGNTLAFSAGNEVTSYATNREIALNAPCQKKFLRDMRAYVQKCSAVPASILPRQVPVGMVNWDFERTLQTLYFNCRTDSSDELENAEWYGLNSYQHCDRSAVSIDDLDGWIKLKQDFTQYNLPVPVIVAEFGCRERFAPIGDFEAQRTWLQVDALYNEEYQQVFAGGVVFEYSAEKRIVDTSPQNKPWPYNAFMKLQYGVGYYSPINCDHLTTLCQYNPYPEFDLLKDKLNAIDVSFVPGVEAFDPAVGEIPECPAGLASLADFAWPSEQQQDELCYAVPTDSPTLAPTLSSKPSLSSAPTPSPSSTPTLMPSAQPYETQTETPSKVPSVSPFNKSSSTPSTKPSELLAATPSDMPSLSATTVQPSLQPSTAAPAKPTSTPSAPPTEEIQMAAPSSAPSLSPNESTFPISPTVGVASAEPTSAAASCAPWSFVAFSIVPVLLLIGSSDLHQAL
jgi:hypothetical protein